LRNSPCTSRPLPRDLARWLVPLLLLLGIGCTEGYPTTDEASLDSQLLSNPQRLEVMNDVGGEAHRRRNWIYELDSHCNLQVTAQNEGEPATVLTYALPGALVLLKSSRTDRTYNVDLARQNDANAKVVPILESEHWVDAVQMTGLVQLLQRDCSITKESTQPS
jgi:hypothetical protein